MNTEAELPWWIRGGEEICDHCLQRYAYEMEYRCVSCDAPVCPLCVIRKYESLTRVCPECASECEEGE